MQVKSLITGNKKEAVSSNSNTGCLVANKEYVRFSLMCQSLLEGSMGRKSCYFYKNSLPLVILALGVGVA